MTAPSTASSIEPSYLDVFAVDEFGGSAENAGGTGIEQLCLSQQSPRTLAEARSYAHRASDG
jgi:hypothetical protein